MNIIDVIIILFILFGGAMGFTRGFTRQLVAFVGVIVIFVLSFLLKNPISVFFYNVMPFFKFGGVFKDVTVLNILLYETLAFFIIFLCLSLVFRLLLSITKAFEKLLKLTIILGIPSKILGAILGLIQYYIFAFLIIYALSLPMFNIKLIKESKLSNFILKETPILNKVCDKTLSVFEEVKSLKDEYKNTTNVDEFNQRALDSMITNGVITRKNAKSLIEKGKIKGVFVE